MFPDMNNANKIKHELSVLGILSSPCYINPQGVTHGTLCN